MNPSSLKPTGKGADAFDRFSSVDQAPASSSPTSGTPLHSPGSPDNTFDSNDLSELDALTPSYRPAGPSTRYAVITVSIIAFVFAVGIVGLVATGGLAPARPSSTTVAVSGAGLESIPVGSVLAPITVSGDPPSDIVAALVLPKGSAFKPGSTVDQSVESYDETIGFTVSDSQAQLLTFYKAELPAQGWTSLSEPHDSTAPRDDEVLAQHASDDGNYWQLGVEIAPTAFPSGSATGVTTFTVRLFIVSDGA